LIGKTQKVIRSSTAVMNVPLVRLFEGHAGYIHTMMFASVVWLRQIYSNCAD
jgi:hypothetical protein